MKYLLSFTLLIVYFYQVESLYFHIRETERKCFIEEVPDETLVVGEFELEIFRRRKKKQKLIMYIFFFIQGKYKVQIFDKDANDYLPTPHGIGMHVEVRDPEQKVILSKVMIHLCILKLIQN